VLFRSGKKRYAAVEETMQAIVAAAATLREQLLDAIDEDIAAFESVLEAFRLPKDDPARADAIQEATAHAADVPLNVARLALETMRLAEQVAAHGNTNAASDAASAAFMGLAAVESAAMNVRINAASLDDAQLATRYRHDASALVESARATRDAVMQTVEVRAGLG